MKIITFTWTVPALLAGAKTATRRKWTLEHAQQFQAGTMVAAYDKSPRAHGMQVATIRLTEDPFRQHLHHATEADYAEEGLLWMEQQGLMVNGISPRQFWERWKAENPYLWVVRFQLVQQP